MNKRAQSIILTSFLVFAPIKASWEAFALTTAGAAATAVLGGIREALTNPEQTRVRFRALMCCCSRDPHATSRLAHFFPESMPWETARMLNRVTNALEYICPDRDKILLADGMSFQTSTYLFELRRGDFDDPDPLNPGANESVNPRVVERSKNRIKGAARRTGRFEQEFFDRVDDAVQRERVKLLVRSDPASDREDLFALIFAGVDPVSGESLNFVVRVSLPASDESSRHARRALGSAARSAHTPPPMARASTEQLPRQTPRTENYAVAASASGAAKDSQDGAREEFRMGTFTGRFQRLARDAHERVSAAQRERLTVPTAAARGTAPTIAQYATPPHERGTDRPSLSIRISDETKTAGSSILEETEMHMITPVTPLDASPAVSLEVSPMVAAPRAQSAPIDGDPSIVMEQQ